MLKLHAVLELSRTVNRLAFYVRDKDANSKAPCSRFCDDSCLHKKCISDDLFIRGKECNFDRDIRKDNLHFEEKWRRALSESQVDDVIKLENISVMLGFYELQLHLLVTQKDTAYIEECSAIARF
jgi:hypothetical protein